MKHPIFIDGIVTPLNNHVLVEIEDTYSERVRESGVILSNAAHDDAKADSPGFHQSEFVVREGVIRAMPRFVALEYDWNPEDEFGVGDRVYWPIVNFHDYTVLKMNANNRVFLLVNYFDIYMKKVDGQPVPVNGYYLFTKINKEVSFMSASFLHNSGWYNLKRKGSKVNYTNSDANDRGEFKEGEDCFLSVPPFQLEADTSEEFNEKYFLAQKRHIIISQKC